MTLNVLFISLFIFKSKVINFIQKSVVNMFSSFLRLSLILVLLMTRLCGSVTKTDS